jgi:hypothetical protein
MPLRALLRAVPAQPACAVNGPFTSIYSRRDRVGSWRAAHDPAARNVEVDAGHLTLLSAPSARRAVAEALARPVAARRLAAA